MSAYFRNGIKHCSQIASKCKFELNFVMFFVSLTHSLSRIFGFGFLHFHTPSLSFVKCTSMFLYGETKRYTNLSNATTSAQHGLFVRNGRKGHLFRGNVLPSNGFSSRLCRQHSLQFTVKIHFSLWIYSFFSSSFVFSPPFAFSPQ